jgi:hypothetical protein
MKHSNENRREGLRSFFESHFVKPTYLAEDEIEIINNFLARLYADLGSCNWIEETFSTALDAYWKMKGATREEAQRYEEEIGPQMHQVVIAGQFSRAASDAVKNYIVENIIDTVPYWNAASDPYPPPDIESMDEPFRRFFLLLNDLVQEMNARNNPAQAMSFLASLMAAFALTYPISYLDSDPYIQRYLKNEVINTPIDDDYTYCLCRDMDYMLFDRF